MFFEKPFPKRINFWVPAGSRHVKRRTKLACGKRTECTRRLSLSCRLPCFCPSLYVPSSPSSAHHNLFTASITTESWRPRNLSTFKARFCLGAGSGLAPSGSPLRTSTILCRECYLVSVSLSGEYFRGAGRRWVRAKWQQPGGFPQRWQTLSSGKQYQNCADN